MFFLPSAACLVPYKYKKWLNIREGFSLYVNSDLPHLLQHIAMNWVQTHNFSGDILFLNGMIPVMQIK
jgi:hypothetical protein